MTADFLKSAFIRVPKPMSIIKPPSPLLDGFSVFLAGSIEMGNADDWQARIEQRLACSDIIIFNPRRDEWDASWIQRIENPQFRQQVEWELAAQEKASLIAMYFDPATKAPISLLELGLFSKSGKLIVCCPEGFWRKGNVDIVCQRYHIEQVDSLEALADRILEAVAAHKQADARSPQIPPLPPMESLLDALDRLVEQAQAYDRALPANNYPARAAVATLARLAQRAHNEAHSLSEAPKPPLPSAHPFSPREHQVLRLASEGLTNKEIAYRLGISERTVQFHINSIFNKTGTNSRTEAVALALRSGWLKGN